MREDYQKERSVIEKKLLESGHLILVSPKYHPELAGLGIEYCWGKGKYDFRNHINDCIAGNLEHNVSTALGARDYTGINDTKLSAPLPVTRVRKYARRARVYWFLFDMFPTPQKAQAALQKWKQKTPEMKLNNGEKVELSALGADATVYDMLDKLYRVYKTHCSMLDIHSSLFSDSCLSR